MSPTDAHPPHGTLAALYARLDAIARGREKHADSWSAHVAVLDRLSSNRRVAEAVGWSSLALERDGGLGRLRLFGVPPATRLRAEVPDLAAPAGDRALA
jgi:allantoicase